MWFCVVLSSIKWNKNNARIFNFRFTPLTISLPDIRGFWWLVLLQCEKKFQQVTVIDSFIFMCNRNPPKSITTGLRSNNYVVKSALFSDTDASNIPFTRIFPFLFARHVFFKSFFLAAYLIPSSLFLFSAFFYLIICLFIYFFSFQYNLLSSFSIFLHLSHFLHSILFLFSLLPFSHFSFLFDFLYFFLKIRHLALFQSFFRIILHSLSILFFF